MAAIPIDLLPPTLSAPLAREGRSVGGRENNNIDFSQHLAQALGTRDTLPNDMPSPPHRDNPFVEEVMAALRQAKESMGVSLTPDLGGMNTAGVQSHWPSSGAASREAYLQQGSSAPANPVRPQTSAENMGYKTSAIHGKEKFDPIIQRASQRYGVDAELIRSVVMVESSFNPKAVSSAGAMGMMQLMPGTAKELGVKDPFDAEQNIMGGTAYLGRLLQRYDGNVRSSLAAYNWGMGNLENKPSSAMPGETRHYVSRIMNMMEDDATA